MSGSGSKLCLFHTPGDGADEIHGNRTLVFGGIELIVMADLSQQLQGHQRGDLNGERTEVFKDQSQKHKWVGPNFIINRLATMWVKNWATSQSRLF